MSTVYPSTPASDPLILQDQSEFNVVFVHSAIDELGLSLAAFRVYCHLARRAKDRVAYPGVDSMAEICMMAKNTVMRAVTELEEFGLLTAHRFPGKVTRYVLAPRSEWKTVAKGHRRKRGNGSTVAKEVTHRRKVGNAPSQKEERKDIQLSISNEGNPVLKDSPSEPDSPYKHFVDQWHKQYAVMLRRPYIFAGGRDGKAVKKLLKTPYDVHQLLGIAQKAWEHGGFYSSRACTIHGLADSLNEILAEIHPPEKAKRLSYAP